MKLELGSWNKREGWITVDLDSRSDLILDLMGPLPFENNSIEQIYSSHLLEHFYFPDMQRLLKECLRVLIPGGLFESAVPNMRPYIEAYLHPEKPFEIPQEHMYLPAYHIFSSIDFINYMGSLNGIHKWMFDEKNLPKIIEYAGFRNARIRDFKEGLDMPERKWESIYVEAIK